jgi:hypothetical protein
MILAVFGPVVLVLGFAGWVAGVFIGNGLGMLLGLAL